MCYVVIKMSDIKLCEKCNKPAEFKCSGCKLVSYCSKDHQKSDWKTHKGVCRPFEIQNSPELGNFLVATRDISPGSLIFSEYPLAFGPRIHLEEGPVPCVGCCRLIHEQHSPRCESCGWPVCSLNCEGIKDPTRHAHECLILGLRSKSGARDSRKICYRQDALFPLRCLLMQKKNKKKFQQILGMEAHMEKRRYGTEVHRDIQERIVEYLQHNFLTHLHKLEEQFSQILFEDISSEVIHKICAVIDVNALEINRDGIVSVLYYFGCLMEHSCVCNTVHTFEDASKSYQITVRAGVPIKKGDHITTSYTHVLWGTQARREHLWETKYFWCTCPRCCDPTELGTYLSALKCVQTGTESCGGFLLPEDPLRENSIWVCNKCKVRLDNGVSAFLVKDIGDQVEQMQANSANVKDMEALLEKMLVLLHPHHYHVYAIKHSLLQLYGHQTGYLYDELNESMLLRKSDMCRELIDVTRKIDPGCSRLTLYSAVLLYELHTSNHTYVKQKWTSEKDKINLANILQEGQRAVLEASQILKDDFTAQAEQLREVVTKAIKTWEIWKERNKEVVELFKNV